jgi:hypothetical protein
MGLLVEGIFQLIAKGFGGRDPWVGVAMLLAFLALFPLFLALRCAWRRWRGGQR